MPELSPKQLTVWLLVAAVILFIGAKALRNQPATAIGPGPGAAAQADGDDAAGDADSRLVFGEQVDSRQQGQGKGPPVHVHVTGAVRSPDLYRLAPQRRVADAIRRAGGATSGADLDQVNLAAALVDGQQIRVPRRGEASSTSPSDGSPSSASAIPDAPSVISLATATSAELETIDGIGPVTAAKILDFRDAQGGIGSVEELDAIPGVGPATMQTLREALVP